MIAQRAATVLLTLVLPSPALAHAAIPGIGGAYTAFTHILTEPPAILALLGLGLLVGLHGAETLKWVWPPFAAAMLTGLATTLMLRLIIDPELPLVLMALTAALLAASGLSLPHAGTVVLGLAAGYALGVFVAPSPASWSTQAYWIAGGLLGANFALVFMVAAVDMIRQQWTMPWIGVGLRILASWIAAICVLMLALASR